MTHHDDEVKFPWLELFIGTGICFLGFYYFLVLISNTHPLIFFWIGILMLVSGALTGLGFFQKMQKRVKRLRRR